MPQKQRVLREQMNSKNTNGWMSWERGIESVKGKKMMMARDGKQSLFLSTGAKRGRLHSGHDSFTWTILSQRGRGGGEWRIGWCGGIEAGVHMAPEAPAVAVRQKGPLLSSHPLFKTLWEFCFAALRSLLLSLRPPQECAFCKPTHTGSLPRCYDHGWCKECSAHLCNINTHWYLKFLRYA